MAKELVEKIFTVLIFLANQDMLSILTMAIFACLLLLHLTQQTYHTQQDHYVLFKHTDTHILSHISPICQVHRCVDSMKMECLIVHKHMETKS